MFTGDRSGEWLYRALHKAGFANQPIAIAQDDGLQLRHCAITAACHCAPPQNRPRKEELANCRPWLTSTIDLVPAKVLLALGHVAWQALVQELAQRKWLAGDRPKFQHHAHVALSQNRWLVASYHPSQQNTFTGRLTEAMLDDVFSQIAQLCG
jgi:uracil-DNA glycosylase family 4